MAYPVAPPRRGVDFPLSNALRRMIDEVILEERTTNKRDIFLILCDRLADKYSGDKLDYQLSRMGIKTTSDIKGAIETYFAINFRNGALYVRDFRPESATPRPEVEVFHVCV